MINVAEIMTDPDFVQSMVLKSVVYTTTNFVTTETTTSQTILASVQPADKAKINPDTIDWSRDYKLIHSATPLALGQFITYGGYDYKINEIINFGDNGYYQVIAEQVK